MGSLRLFRVDVPFVPGALSPVWFEVRLQIRVHPRSHPCDQFTNVFEFLGG